MVIITGYLMPMISGYAMKYRNQILVRTSKLKSGVLHRLNNHITENRKLNLYASFKTTYKSEPYLDYITNFTVRSTLANLRLSARNLDIETGRFSKNKTPRDERCCPYCKTLIISAVENEVHFLLSCSLFNEERQQFLEEICRNFPNTATSNELNLFTWLMTQEDILTTKLLRKFCKASFDQTV